jgi:putative RNA 2'-phosphotransferase
MAINNVKSIPVIRANQGHSITVDLGLQGKMPPELLYHGTATRNVTAILHEGIKRRKRNFVHLSLDDGAALLVGRRYGKPIVLVVQAGQMHRDGFLFYLSENGVWLTEHVPAGYVALKGYIDHATNRPKDERPRAYFFITTEM